MSFRASERLAWSICGASFALIAAGFLLLILNRSTVHASSWFLIIFYAPALTFSTLGALIAARRPKNPIGWMLASFGLITALQYFTAEYAIRGFVTAPGSLPAATLMAWLNNWIYYPNIWIVTPLFFLLFPGGHVPSRRWIPLVWLVIALASLQGLVVILTPGTIVGTNEGQSHLYNLVRNPTGVDQLAPLINSWKGLLAVLLLGAAIACFVAFVRRFFGARGDERQQLKWLAAMGAVAIVANVLGLFIQSGLGSDLLYLIGIVSLAIGLPGGATLAILKYRLYDIDVVINRTLVYGTLAAFITTVYVAIVVGVGTLFNGGSRPNLALSIIATAVVAVAFQPVRGRVQRFANRLVFGQRATPYEVMAGFADQMAGTLSAETVLPQMAEAAARGVGAQAARVVLRLPDGAMRVTIWPTTAGDAPYPKTLLVVHQGEHIGEISVRKGPGETISPGEQRLLADLAAQAGLVLHNVRLTAELQGRLTDLSDQAVELRASRQRILSAQETERRRLGAEIRTGVERELEATSAQLEEVEKLLAVDGEAAARRLDILTVATQQTLDRLREVARGIYPPLLADRGIVPALEAHARRAGLHASIEARPEFLATRFDPSIEAAMFFCCLEALRGAEAVVVIRLSITDGTLRFDVDGVAPVKGRLEGIRDRVEALGGRLGQPTPGCLAGRVPLKTPELVG
jgi:signal transduction histidine kinase